MTKEQLIDRHAQNLKSWVGTSLAKEECIGLIKNAVDEVLTLIAVSHQRELLNWMKRNNHLGKTEEQIEEILLDYNFESI